ncbi:mitochondrion protein [Aspergillus heteromorphus CBS 117.55]|uniref:MICOS complex subunit MIC60 n=1 Tax=Aspergillus heteromorphus CBS 117.55 TaxID=1448321 RepID=A0A317WM51_9EURO|nr:mitochondrion protein [Aspergillus heteromorphus CBS 117.55]PWY86098.1 mitochondrion protein [Aspergillus heteromorphus CBS 117.55]
MLRSSVAPGRQLLLSSARQRTAPQWLSRAGASSRLAGQRFFADSKPIPPAAPTPATPSPGSVVPPETVPKPSQGSEIPPPPPSAPAPKKGGRFRRFLLYLLLTSGFAYGGSIFLALKFDNFHDFFTEYIPYGEESVLYFEERDFYRRFPNTLRNQNRLPSTTRDEGNKITIGSKSGLTSKVAQEEQSGSDVSQKGPHNSAVQAQKSTDAQVKADSAKPEDKTTAVLKAKEDKAAKEEAPRPAVKEEPRQPALPPVAPLEFSKVNEGDEAIVQELVKTFNDIITVLSADENAGRFSKPVEKAKEELQKVGEKIIAVREEARRAAQEEIKQAHETFDESARELIRRFDSMRAADVNQFREEFETEREKLAHAYQQKINTELRRAQEVAEQRLKNELVEQAIELNRKYLHEVRDLVEREREGRLSKLGELSADVSELEKLTSGWREVIDTNLRTQQLQVAVDAVRSVLERSAVPRPFVRELVAVKELAAEDPVVEAAIASINPTAYQRGIPSTSQIIERFRRVADEVRKASLLPEDAGIASHAASLVLSKVMFKKDAVAGSDDVESVLCRTESLLEEGNIDAAAREMNSLNGWAKILSKDWLGDVRRVLEVKQALEHSPHGPSCLPSFANDTPFLSRGPDHHLVALAFMSLEIDESHPPSHPMPRADERQSEPHTSPNNSHDASDRRKGLQMNEGRASGELEGSTLGSSSRDGDKGGRPQRRTPSSGGFLVDSSFLPRSTSLRTSHYLPRRSDPDRKEKREAPEPDLVLPKKRSRFPWSRHKDSKAPQADTRKPTTAEEVPAPSHVEQDAVSQESHTRAAEGQAPVGLDRDSLQIVNLALNLSESRKQNSLGRSASTRLSGGRWAMSSVGGLGHSGPQYGRDVPQALGDERNKPLGLQRVDLSPMPAPSSVANLLPQSAGSETLPQGFSESTLARAERARRHFELFSEYLRLLPSLPPLARLDGHTADSASVSSNSFPSHRAYNPIQCIRNRKVRFRERCAIDTQAEGWYDTDKVHQWVDSVEAQYSQQSHSPLECLSLPSFHHCTKERLREEPGEVDHLAVSPPSSLRRASRASSVKARRPRSDWIIDPAELLSDAAWVEEGQNKTKIVDRDGNNLYPDPSTLITFHLDQATPDLEEQPHYTRQSVDSEHPTSRTSLSDARPGLTTEFKRVGRGRRRHRFRSSGRSGHGSEASRKGTSSRRHKLGLLSSSSSSISSADQQLYRDHSMDNGLSMGRQSSPPGAARLRGSQAISEDESAIDTRLTPTHSTFPYYKSGKSPTWARSEGKRSSMSSVPSVDDRYDLLTNLATAESRSPDVHSHIGIFPSIAANLSPPSSRSPSPSKGRFSRALGSRHERERSKSNIRTKEVSDNTSLEPTGLRNSFSGYPEDGTHGMKSEPSPVPDRVPSVYLEDQPRAQLQPRKEALPPESKLRGIFKGPGKIAEKVGNEMSKVGDLIMKKDNLAHSRKSSLSSIDSLDSNPLDDLDESKGDKMSGAKSLLRRFPTFSDDSSRTSRRNLEKLTSKTSAPSPLPFASSAGQDRLEEHPTSEQTSPPRHGPDSGTYTDAAEPHRDIGGFSPTLHTPLARPEKLRFGPELHTVREQIKKGDIKDPGVPISMTRPPITGLAQARADTSSPSQVKRPKLADQSRSWSISNRSISNALVVGVPGKREVERTRALLLSSGIKAREITRRADCVRNPPPDFLRRSFGAGALIPEVTRLYEYEVAAEGLLNNFEKTQHQFQQSIDNFPGSVSSPLKSQLSKLEDIVNGTISPRIQAATQDAEDLSIQLNTTSTLAVKQLSDTLDKGVRRRHRRLRWVRRTGFVMLEWALVGMLWWVWLIVMAFKILRGISRGLLSGVRWVLWL